jgi:hypothetical protein
MRILFQVLHPCHKLAYFEAARWDQAWIETARDLVREQFELRYAALPTTNSTEDGPTGNSVDMQGTLTSKSMVHRTSYFL